MRAVIFANGVIENLDSVKKLFSEGDYIISADGGLRYLLALKKMPDLLIGDLDSVADEEMKFVKENKVEIQKFPTSKDQTDLELAITEVVNRGYDDILVIGALGGRLDQTLANISLITHNLIENIKIEFDDGNEHVFLVKGSEKIFGEKGDTVSLLPYCMPVEGITTLGLEYPLDNETLYPDKTRGISNVMSQNVAEIVLRSGELLCIHSRKPAG